MNHPAVAPQNIASPGAAANQSSQPSSTPSATITPPSRNAQKSKQEPPSRYSRWVSEWIINWWGIELVCLVIVYLSHAKIFYPKWAMLIVVLQAAISLVAIIVILESYRGKPLPEWSSGHITLNSVISILATIGQMAMMKPVVECISQLKWLYFIRKQKLSGFEDFDGASRGPLGSLLLLGKLRGMHLVCLGTVITVAAAAFGPFAQQVVTYPLYLHPVGTAQAQQVFDYTVVEIAGEPLSASVSAGLSSSQSTNLSAVVPICSTGNCTWTEYSSVGVCSSVSDLSSSIMSNPCNLTIFQEVFGSNNNPGYPCYNYTLPQLQTQVNALEETPQGNVTLSNALTDDDFSPPGSGQMQTMVLDTAYNNLSSMYTAYLMYQPDLLTSINSSLPSPIAYGLNLNPCVQTYNTVVSRGVVNTTLISSKIFNTSLEYAYLPVNESVLYSGNSPNITIGDDVFSFDLQALFGVNDLLDQLIPALCFQFPPTDGYHEVGDYNWFCPRTSGPNFLYALANSTDPLSAVTDIWSDMATSMTNLFRMDGGQNQVSQFPGVASAPVAFVETQYLWLILPFGLVLFTMVFLVATILKSKRHGSRVWKSSNLATLQGLDVQLHSRLGGISSITEMQERANELEVRFDMEGGKAEHGVEYRLVELKQDPFWRG